MLTPDDRPLERPAGGTRATEPSRAPQTEEPAGTIVTLAEGLSVDLVDRVVHVRAWTCLDAGWLEQVACTAGTREHEALVVVGPRPSDIHTALLAAGFESGRPGLWRYDDEGYTFEPPSGAELEIFVRYARPDGSTITEPIRGWIREHGSLERLPSRPWVFAGSGFRSNLPGLEAGAHYIADLTGSVIGLVTFGDEVIGFAEVFADQESVQPREWEVDPDAVPPPQTEVELLIRACDPAPSAP